MRKQAEEMLNNYALIKEALDIPTARKAMNAQKQHVIRRAQDPAILEPVNVRHKSFFFPKGSTHPVTKGTMPGQDPLPSAGKIFMKGRTFPALNYPKIPGMPALHPNQYLKTPQDMEMFNRITMMHEHAERMALQGKNRVSGQVWGSHLRPKVLLQESNMLASLPKDLSRVREAQQYMRNAQSPGREGAVLEKAFPGYRFGETRLSRHAIKRMEESLARRGMGPKSVEEVWAAKLMGKQPFESFGLGA